MRRHSIARIVSTALVMVCALVTAPMGAQVAFADPCPNAEVVFARGTGEPPGVGGTGQAFIDSLTADVSGRSVGVYPVNYPATDDYINSAKAGAADADAHIQSTATSCPNTKLVLGGYSQGAAVMDLASNQLPAPVGRHVAAVVLFGNPNTSSSYSTHLGADQIPPINPAYQPKTDAICLPNDIVCSNGGSMLAHLSYVPDATNQAATFVAGRL
jgi:cutinase